MIRRILQVRKILWWYIIKNDYIEGTIEEIEDWISNKDCDELVDELYDIGILTEDLSSSESDIYQLDLKTLTLYKIQDKEKIKISHDKRLGSWYENSIIN
jgi:hypothetical protein